MEVPVGRRTRQLDGTVRTSDETIGRHGGLQNHERTPARHPGEERRVLESCLVAAEIELDLRAVRPKKLDAAPGYFRVGILNRRDHAGDARGDDPFDARSGSAGMRARLERAVQRGAARAIARHVERGDLGVRPARGQMRALTDHDAVARDDDGANDWIRAGAASAALRQEQRARHERAVVVHLSVKSAST